MRDEFFTYPENYSASISSLSASVSLLQTEGDGIRLGLFIDADKKIISHTRIADILDSLRRIDDDIFYCFIVASGKYAKFFVKFFEELLSSLSIATAYEAVLKDGVADIIIADIKAEKYSTLPYGVYARLRARRYLKKNICSNSKEN